MLTPTRLVLARKMRRMTLARLAEMSGISSRSITAYENGSKVPTPATLQILAEALSVPTGFLTAPDAENIPTEAISFRALSKMSASERESARSVSDICIEINAWLEDRFNLPQPSLPTLPRVPPEEAAFRVRSAWGLGEAPIPNMIHLLESKGIRVFSLPANCESVDAFSFSSSSGAKFVVLSQKKSSERSRFDAAHELGHLIMHSEHRIPSGPNAEQEANRFASAFLMPRSGILAQMLRNADSERIIRAKKKWGVSALALAYRLKDLELASEWSYRSSVKRLSQLGYRSAEPGGIPRETSQLLQKVMSALRQEGIRLGEMAEDVNLHETEIHKYFFGLVPLPVQGSGESTSSKRDHLRLV
ncbi:helix-turn-helix domain-containing protein [Nocardiopsis sp. LDBS1602]|uniref:helix-turn-helix domain-containing protein n=1 Tax=Nocardiopsis sp. LDBS1602 TaxID=3109597 RepID=UPI002DB81D71|nr:XRE family transcriptional regulator [Nocardiopsis sp. LDBS1602]MEC3893572.1 XRE family transcriptional regulator [Nocardiopsis sp. LDBS1602]